jgi:Protein of unknwon function (DUF3310)
MIANKTQVGGDHYQGGDYQHWDMCATFYGEAFFKCTASKYVIRWRKKNGAEDLNKALHYLLKLKELVAKGGVKLNHYTPDAIEAAIVRLPIMVVQDAVLMYKILAADDMLSLNSAIDYLEQIFFDLDEAPT